MLACTTELSPLCSSQAQPSRRSPTAGEHAASTVSAPIPDCNRVKVTVGALGLSTRGVPTWTRGVANSGPGAGASG